MNRLFSPARWSARTTFRGSGSGSAATSVPARGITPYDPATERGSPLRATVEKSPTLFRVEMPACMQAVSGFEAGAAETLAGAAVTARAAPRVARAARVVRMGSSFVQGLSHQCAECPAVCPGFVAGLSYPGPMYSVQHASRLTGIPADTLRMWERRYHVVDPVRSDAGYRMYDDAGLRRLSAMRALVAAGW